MKISVLTLGCKVNECESRSIITALKEAGQDVIEEILPADYYVINTCSVTNEADRKSRQMIGKATKANPNAKIFVCGCSSERNPKIYEKYKNVVHISGNANKYDVFKCIVSDISECFSKNNINNLPLVFEELPTPYHAKTRDYIKIQDGCNNFCSYCIIPYVRGRSRSRTIDSILSEVEISSKRTKEIVLTGIDVSSYGKDIGSSLTELVKSLSDFPIRKRLSSFECTVITDELLSALKSSHFCDHFHLSLQSGSDKTLKAMNRRYDTQTYFNIVQKIRSYFPNAGITTDVITGFPTETEKDFLDTLSFIKTVGFSDIHVFPYSEREGTKASKLPQLPMCERRARARELLKIKEESKKSFLLKQIGQELSVYYEESENGVSCGYAENYTKVYGDGIPGQIQTKIISKIFEEGVK